MAQQRFVAQARFWWPRTGGHPHLVARWLQGISRISVCRRQQVAAQLGGTRWSRFSKGRSVMRRIRGALSCCCRPRWSRSLCGRCPQRLSRGSRARSGGDGFRRRGGRTATTSTAATECTGATARTMGALVQGSAPSIGGRWRCERREVVYNGREGGAGPTYMSTQRVGGR